MNKIQLIQLNFIPSKTSHPKQDVKKVAKFVKVRKSSYIDRFYKRGVLGLLIANVSI